MSHEGEGAPPASWPPCWLLDVHSKSSGSRLFQKSRSRRFHSVWTLFFCLFQCFEETEYQTESKWNKIFGNVIFSLNVIQETWTLRQGIGEAVTRVGGCPPRARPLPRGPLGAPLTYFFRLYISIYPKNIREHNRSGVPPPEASVATKNQLGPCSGTLPEGGNPHRWPSSSSRCSP